MNSVISGKSITESAFEVAAHFRKGDLVYGDQIISKAISSKSLVGGLTLISKLALGCSAAASLPILFGVAATGVGFMMSGEMGLGSMLLAGSTTGAVVAVALINSAFNSFYSAIKTSAQENLGVIEGIKSDIKYVVDKSVKEYDISQRGELKYLVYDGRKPEYGVFTLTEAEWKAYDRSGNVIEIAPGKDKTTVIRTFTDGKLNSIVADAPAMIVVDTATSASGIKKCFMARQGTIDKEMTPELYEAFAKEHAIIKPESSFIGSILSKMEKAVDAFFEPPVAGRR